MLNDLEYRISLPATVNTKNLHSVNAETPLAKGHDRTAKLAKGESVFDA